MNYLILAAPHQEFPFNNEPTFILALILFALALTLIGIFSRYKIFALFSVAIYFHLAFTFSEDEFLALTMVGLMIFNVYIALYTGGRE